MVGIIIKPEWHLSDKDATPEELYLSRRSFLKKAGIFSSLSMLWSFGCNKTASPQKKLNPSNQYDGSFAKTSFQSKLGKNTQFQSVPKRTITPEILAASYNNYYEFTQKKELVWRLARNFSTRPWTIKVSGLTSKPKTYDLEKLVKRLALEERVYRFRCVEAWSMVVPWIGIPLKDLIRFLEPLSKARYVRFIGWKRPTEAPGQVNSSYDWPYYEALRLDEATNELALFTVGMYGHPLTKQNGAPVRIITPWKYGYKSMKGVTHIEFVRKQPPTFWNESVPDEYGFYSNVNPRVPHPRWSQAEERVLGSRGFSVGLSEKIATLPYNGYTKQVAHIYSGNEF